MKDYFANVVLVTANQLLSWSDHDTVDGSERNGVRDQNACEVYAKEPLECTQGVSAPRASMCIVLDIHDLTSAILY